MIWHSLLIATATIAALLIVACGRVSETEQHFKKRVKFQGHGRLREAIAQYDGAIRLNPQTTYDAYFNRGNAYVTLENLIGSLPFVTIARRFDLTPGIPAPT